MKKLLFTLWIGILGVNPAPLYAYNPLTHQTMSEHAFNVSALATDPKILDSLGLPPLGANKQYPNSVYFPESKVIVELFRDGAKFEDDLTRPLNHFFDPLTGNGLVGSPSPDWAIDGTGDSSTIKFSFKAAREYLWQATANPLNSYDYRQTQFGLMFRSLGQVIHHIQDMAQPQHVRNDAHCDSPLCYLIGAYNKSAYEQYTKTAPSLPYTNNDYNASTQVKFSTARQFWTTGTGQGMAEFTNSNFLSAGTNFNSGKYTFPVYDDAYSETVTAAQLCLELGASCTPILQAFPTATLTFYGNDVEDKYNQTITQNWRASSESVFDAALQEAGRSKVFTLNSFNFDAAQQFLIPRAVGYSAGLINYFFRGKMQISLPDEGVYGLVDHSGFANTDPLTNFTGFNKIKLKLSNTSPNAEAMSGGKLLAVLKFRRNSCYKDDLSGYPPFVNEDTCRTAQEEIVVSNTMDNVALSSAPQSFEFNFAQALPINATDVYLQVVYRGSLGQEADAVVVATQDIAEPTFFSYMNASDYILLGTKVYTRPEINADPGLLSQVRPLSCVNHDLSPPQLQPHCLNPFSITMTFTLGGSTTIRIDGMLKKQFLRFAFLGEASPPSSPPPTLLGQTGPCYPLTPFSIPPMRWQSTYDSSANTLTLYYPTFQKIRGVSGYYGTSCISNGDNSTLGSPDERNAMMLDVDSQIPVAVQITP